jgi:hypothetical protein
LQSKKVVNEKLSLKEVVAKTIRQVYWKIIEIYRLRESKLIGFVSPAGNHAEMQ